MNDATKEPELLPCPFCGGEAHIDGTSWTTRNGKDQAWVTCKKCHTYGPSSTDATAAWNRRATPDALAASPEVAALIAAAILDAQLRCMERGRIDTPNEIRTAASLRGEKEPK